jgi:hypothetical protein
MRAVLARRASVVTPAPTAGDGESDEQRNQTSRADGFIPWSRCSCQASVGSCCHAGNGTMLKMKVASRWSGESARALAAASAFDSVDAAWVIMRASPAVPGRLSLGTISASADQFSADDCFAMAEQA